MEGPGFFFSGAFISGSLFNRGGLKICCARARKGAKKKMSNTPFGNLPLLPGMVALGSEEEFPLVAQKLLGKQSSSPGCPCRDFLGQCQPSDVCAGNHPASNFPGEGMVHDAVTAAKTLSGIGAFFADPKRWITFLLGVLLVAAGLFSHPAVREKIVAAGKTAGKAAALAA